MENVDRLQYRQDLDVPENVTAAAYRKLRSNPQLHADRIRHVLEDVKTLDGSDAHLAFNFTGYYPRGKHYICAVWPLQPAVVEYGFVEHLELEKIARGIVTLSIGDPSEIEIVWSRRPAARKYYMFFQENPHAAHRPYFFTRYDEMFRREEQDDAQVLAHHEPSIHKRWATIRKSVESRLPISSLDDLRDLEKEFRMFGTDRRNKE